ncbi:MAG: tetratricopeptide repeat protein, partial [Acidobacteria bacterium]|nr:tetratricopeptide repeat protein [Acidobacteriota bacterium]
MHRQKFAQPRLVVFIMCLLFSLVLTNGAAVRATGQTGDPDRLRAFQLFNDSKFTEALPLLKKLADANPDDPAVLEKYGFSLLAVTRTVDDQATRQKMIERARVALLRSKQLGNNSNLLQAALEAVASGGGGGKPAFSENKEAERAMYEGEAAYTRGELNQAAAAYAKALKLDPTIYEAALFAGDMYFKLKEWDKAGEWFTKAIGINADRETAYRYWGDALMMGQDKKEESRLKFVEAIVAEPYKRQAWVGLMQWAQRYKVRLGHPRIEPQVSVSPLKDNKMTITVDPKSLEKKDDGTSAWLFYGIARAAWQTEKFAKEFPGEKTYRHSLREEAEALRGVAELVGQQTKEGKVKQLDPALASLLKLQDAGLLEAYILLAHPDDGIARDYEAYRR